MIKKTLKLALSTFILINTSLIVYSHPGHSNYDEDKNPYERLIHVQDFHWKIETSEQNIIKVSILDKNLKPISLDKVIGKALIKTRKYKKEIDLIKDGDYLKGNISLFNEKKYQVIVSVVIESKSYKGTFVF